MKETTLQKICLVISIFGIFCLIIISQKIKPINLEISQISKEYINKEIKVQGQITKITNKDTVSIIEISSKKSNIQVISYKEDLKKLAKGEKVQVTGILKEYRNTLQIEARTIILT